MPPTLADTIDNLGVILPVLAVIGVLVVYAATKWGRKVMKDSHEAGQRMGYDAGKKAGERLASLFQRKDK